MYPLLMITLVRRGEQAAKVFQLLDIPAMEAASRIFHRCSVILSDNDEKLAPQSNDNDKEPQQQAVFFYRRLLRAESYRKALVWQKRLIIIINYCD